MKKLLPKVGVGVIVVKNNKVLLGKRICDPGKASWGFPGGHLEYGETLENCAKREVLEETGILIKNIKLETFTNDLFVKDNKHYITLYAVAEYYSGELKLMEPNKCQKWKYYDWSSLPTPLFLPIKNLLKQQYNPFHHNIHNYGF
jgi:8-oxo-dGTP diphosphatase